MFLGYLFLASCWISLA